MNAPNAHRNEQILNTADLALFQPGKIGGIEVKNRVVMAPLTRCRADEAAGDIPGSPMNVLYYTQRANAGLIISEGTQVAPGGKGYMATPGIYSEQQIEGWKPITQAVHAAGSKIVAQIWHVGRITHPNLTGGLDPIAPSAIAPGVVAYTHQGKVDIPVPHAMSVTEIQDVIAQFRQGAANAMRAGFDGVEIHGANGYLIDQFLRDGANQRTDAYGGTVENRARFALELVDAVVAEIGADKVGIRLSPLTPFNNLSDSNPQALFSYLIQELDKRNIGFIHMIEGATGGDRNVPGFDYQAARRSFKGSWIVNNGYTREMAIEAVQEKRADAVSFGRLYIANPDLVERLKQNAPMNEPDPNTFYVPGEKGYTDYPTLSKA
ncbi:alkene reductase [Limnobacter sp.]|uniref:alkene reductase n=1 Tax=Limnobacter sp. TaxID=2003368 RepID=UPI003512FE1C